MFLVVIFVITKFRQKFETPLIQHQKLIAKQYENIIKQCLCSI